MSIFLRPRFYNLKTDDLWPEVNQKVKEETEQ